MSVSVNAHKVSAIRIESIQPLRRGGQLVHPDEGVLIILSDGTKKKWLNEGGVPAKAGDLLISDTDLNATYVINPEKFAELFVVTAAD
jgi:hypothetical protein